MARHSDAHMTSGEVATNVLCLVSDQHTRRILGAYGNIAVDTPNLDALAANGTLFTRAYCASPICVPSRAGMATGRPVHQLGNWDNAHPYTGREAASWGHRLVSQGYPVTTIGKLHYSSANDPTGFPDQRLPMHVTEGGGVRGLLRGEMPPAKSSREHVLNAGPGESEYTGYDRAIAAEAVRWLHDEAAQHKEPWVLFVSFVSPHFPLLVPEPYWQRYADRELPMPVAYRREQWSRHPAVVAQRRMQSHDEEFDSDTIRSALAAYYGLVTFLDDHIGRVLQALRESGLSRSTRVIYTSDHGELLGEHGLWWKSSMYEGSVGVPLIVSGPGVPTGHRCRTPVSLLDLFPTIVQGTGAHLTREDADLPGRSLWELANEPDDESRFVFSEYHATYSTTGTYMTISHRGRYKYVHHVGMPPQLFDLADDPHELHDLAAHPDHDEVVRSCEAQLRTLVDPERIDLRARTDQRQRLEELGGPEVARAVDFSHTPVTESARRSRLRAEEGGDRR